MIYPNASLLLSGQDSGTTVVGAVCARTKDSSYTVPWKKTGKIWQFPLVSSMVSIMIGTRGDRCFWNLGISRSLWLNHVAWSIWRHASCTWRHLIVLHIISNMPRKATSFNTRVLFCHATAFHNMSCLIVFCSGFTILWLVCALNCKILVAVFVFGAGRRQGASLHDQSYRVVWHDVTSGGRSVDAVSNPTISKYLAPFPDD